MNCTKCNAPLQEGDLFCKACGYQHAVNEQAEKLAQAKANTKGIIVSQFRTTIFLVFTICFTAMFASFVISMFSGGIWGIFSSALSFIFMLIAMIGLWKCYAAKETTNVSDVLQQASIYDAYQRVMATVSIVLQAVACGILALVVLFAGSALSEYIGSEEGLMGGVIGAIIVVIIFGITITITALLKTVYKNRRLYFMTLSKSAETGEYKATKAPVIGSYILGGYSVLGSIFPIVIGALGSTIVKALFDVLSEVADLGAYEGELAALMSTIISALVIAGISQLVSGAYYILSALWMANVHTAEVKNNELIESAAAALAETQDRTRVAFVHYEAEAKQG